MIHKKVVAFLKFGLHRRKGVENWPLVAGARVLLWPQTNMLKTKLKELRTDH